jgi:GH43 family beta-xylosidase
MSDLLEPLIRQRADPHISRHADGFYYFTASVPAYDRIEIRRATTLQGLADAPVVDVWRKPDTGPYSELIWAPELHFNDGAWYVYFAAAPTRALDGLGMFQHRMFALRNTASDPLEGAWDFLGQVDTGIDSFCLDATTFTHKGQLYYLWAQKDPAIAGNSNLYLAPMKTPWQLDGAPVLLSRPEHDWECRGFLVNEGPSVLQRHGRVFILLDPASWHKSPEPVMRSAPEDSIFGPGHNSFTVGATPEEVLLVYHARTYTEIVGDPLWNPDRHSFVKPLRWSEDGMPLFGRPSRLD